MDTYANDHITSSLPSSSSPPPSPKMWPLKAHYCLWFGSLSGILPYVSIFARTHLGVSATAVGILYCILPFVVSFGKPVACSFADYLDKHTEALLLSQVITLFGYGLLVVIPFIVSHLTTTTTLLWYLFCVLTLFANTFMGIGVSLTDYLVMHEVTSVNQAGGDTNYGSYRIWGTVGFGAFGILSGVINENSQHLPYLLPGLLMFITIEVLDIGCIYRFFYYRLQRQNSHRRRSSHRQSDVTAVYHHHHNQQSDTTVAASTSPNHQSATKSNDNDNNDDEFVDIELDPPPYLTTTTIPNGDGCGGVVKIKSSTTTRHQLPLHQRIVRNIKSTLNSTKIILYQIGLIYYHYPSLLQHTFIIFCFGLLTAFHWSFFFWYLEDIRGKDSLLMGLCMFVNSFVGEIPVFMVAHHIIQRIGPIFSFCVSLCAFALRYLCYGYLLHKEPGKYWDVLLIETLQGLTFSLFYTVMTHVAQYYADKCDKISLPDGTPLMMMATVVAAKNKKKKMKMMIDDAENGKVAGDGESSLSSPTHQKSDTSSRKSSIDDQVERDYEVSVTMKMNPESLNTTSADHHHNRNHQNDYDDDNVDDDNVSIEMLRKPSATMQGLMSACYEGIGLGVGSLLGGYLIDRLSVYDIWRIAGFFSIALVVFNCIIEICKFVYGKSQYRQKQHRRRTSSNRPHSVR